MGNQLFFIADIASNHNGSLDRALDLIELAALHGADAVKFQHFTADTLLNKKAFDSMPKKAHQKNWDKSVWEVFEENSIPFQWTKPLYLACQKAGIEFMSTPYYLEAVDHLNPFVSRWKVGSGDIDNYPLLRKLAETGKEIILSTGASDMYEVEDALETISYTNHRCPVVLLQCNTNYTGNDSVNKLHVNLNVLKTYANDFNVPVGLSDHTKDLDVIKCAVALGATYIERHFTKFSGTGPDHGFSMNPTEWWYMVKSANDVLKMLGSGAKCVAGNEYEAHSVQRRGVYASRDIKAGEIITESDYVLLRPKLTVIDKNKRIISLSPGEIDDMFDGNFVVFAARDINKHDILTESNISTSLNSEYGDEPEDD